MTALHFACRYVNKEVVRLLLRFYANVNALVNHFLFSLNRTFREDKEKWRPLHYASKYFQRDLSRDLTGIIINISLFLTENAFQRHF